VGRGGGQNDVKCGPTNFPFGGVGLQLRMGAAWEGVDVPPRLYRGENVRGEVDPGADIVIVSHEEPINLGIEGADAMNGIADHRGRALPYLLDERLETAGHLGLSRRLHNT